MTLEEAIENLKKEVKYTIDEEAINIVLARLDVLENIKTKTIEQLQQLADSL